MGDSTEARFDPDLNAIPQLSASVCQQALMVLKSEETRKILSPLFGIEFFDMLKVAPCEYAALTLLGHMAIVFPSGAMHILDAGQWDSGKWKSWTPLAMQTTNLYEKFYHLLSPSLTAGNQSVCEFKGLRCPSWHGIVCQYTVNAITAIDEGPPCQ